MYKITTYCKGYSRKEMINYEKLDKRRGTSRIQREKIIRSNDYKKIATQNEVNMRIR